MILQSYTRLRRMHRVQCTCVLLVLLVMLAGCGSVTPELESFGAVKGVDARRSANGLQVHRKMWESAGVKCLLPSKLSPRLETVDTIVLVGQTFQPPGRAAREWLEEWLSHDKNRTVIYFGRDFNAEVYFRNRTLQAVEMEKQRRARVLVAKAQTAELSQRMQQIGESTFCRWFYYDVSIARDEYVASDLTGPWAQDLSGLEGKWPVGVTLREPSLAWKKKLPSWLQPGAANNGFQAVPTIGQLPANSNTDTVFSQWNLQELDSQEAWDEEFEGLLQPETLLATRDGRPLVFSLNSKKQSSSRILVVANGAPFLNASMVDPLHRNVGARIVESCLPADRVAVLAYGYRGLTISKIPETEKGITGLEVLTAWPLSAVTIPMVALGIVICSVLFRRLGRAQNLPKPSRSDFGLHIETLGQMLHKSGDEVFAVLAVREYFIKVRNENPPAWLEQQLAAVERKTGNQVATGSALAANPPPGGDFLPGTVDASPQRNHSASEAGPAPEKPEGDDIEVWGDLELEGGKDSNSADSPGSKTN